MAAERDMLGKVVLLTGGTEGIGRASARQLAARGATLTLVARNPQKGRQVVEELTAAGVAAPVTLLLGDLSLRADIQRVAAEFKAANTRLDVLINNAGAIFNRRTLTSEGTEMTFALNHVAYFLLTHQLLDLLKATPGARVVSTSSGAHHMGKLDLDDMPTRSKGYRGFPVYGDSKLCNVLFTRELARHLKASGGVANCFHPGVVHTGFGVNNKDFTGALTGVFTSLVGRTPQKGAETQMWLAASPEGGTHTGQYFHDLKPARSSPLARDDARAADLWAFSARLCGVAA